MCHLILMMPVIGLGVFWIWPFATALPVYLVILLLSAFVYFAMIRAMHRPVVTGAGGLIGQIADVSDTNGHEGHVHVHGEIWRAVSDDLVEPGGKAVIVRIDGMTLEIRKSSGQPRPVAADKHCPI
jgi:membrane-bound serine protease (ClpP class)